MDKYSKSYVPSIGRTSLFEVEPTPPPAAHSGASILKRPLNSHPSLPNDQPVINIHEARTSNKRSKSSKQSSSSSSSSSSSTLTPASLISASASTMGLDSIHQANLLRHHRSNPYNPASHQQSFDASRYPQAHLASTSTELPMKLTKYDDHSVKGNSKLVNLSSKSQNESPRISAHQTDESEKDVPLNLSVKRPMDNDSPAGSSEMLRMSKSSSSSLNCDVNRDVPGPQQRKKQKRQQQIHLQQQQLIQLQQQQQKQLQQHQQQLQMQHLQQQSKSLLLSNPTEVITIPSIPHDGKPRKRGRPPILSPPPEPSRSEGPSISASLAASIANNPGLHPAAAASLLASAQGALNPLEIYKTLLAQNCFQSMFTPGSFLFPGHLNGDPLGALNRANSLNLNNQLSKPNHQNNNGNSSNSKVIVCEPVEDKRKRDSSRGDAFEGDSDLADTEDIDYETPKVFNEEELRKPMKFGWRRQTLIQCITKSGIRGEVIYYSPSGKKMRNMTELCRYLIKKNISTIRKENFSFDSRPIIGEFIEHSKEKGTSFNLLSEGEVRVRLEDIKKRLQSSSIDGARSDVDDNVSDAEAKPVESASPRAFKRDTPFYNDQKPKEQQTRVTIEEIETLRDDMFKRYQESKESSERRYQTPMFPESDFYKKKDLEMVAEIERERRKQHMMLVRALDNHKRFEERERRSRQEIAEKRAIMEKKFQKRKAEIEIYKELKRSVEDMLLKNSKALPTLNRIPGLKLPSRVFADCLMFFEFLHNFGETLGFDMESLPSLNNLQKALLNLDDSAEKELVSTLHQLLVCAIDDPGIPCNISTVMGQKLKDAPITDFNISEILKLYFQSFSNTHSDSSDEEYTPTIVYEVLKSGKPFLSLNAAQKMDILGFICNELTSNQAIVRQIEQTVESLILLRREKWVLGCELRKYKAIKLRREKATSEEAGEALKKFDKTEIDAGLLEDSGDSDVDDNIIITVHETDEEATITNEELDKKLDKLAKQCAQMNVKLTNAMQCMRVVPLGQDRYRRRFWVLPASGGIFVEGLESGHRDNLYMEDSEDEEAEESSETEEETEGEHENKNKDEDEDEERKLKTDDAIDTDGKVDDDEVQPEEMKVKEEKRGKKRSKKNQEASEKGKGKAKPESQSKEGSADIDIKESTDDKGDTEAETESEDRMEVVEVKEVKKEKSGRVKLENLGDGKHSLSPEVTIELKGMVSEEKPSNRETTVTIQPVSAPLKSLHKEEIKCDMEIAGVDTIRPSLGSNSDGTWISPVTDGFPRSSLFDSKIGPSNSSDFNSRNGFLDASGFPYETVCPERSWFNVVPRVPCNDTTITILPVATINAASSSPTNDSHSNSKVNESSEESESKPLISSENSSSTKPSQNVFMETFVYPHLSGSLFSQNSTNATNGAKSEANSTNDLHSHPPTSSSLTNGDIDMSVVNPALLMGPEFELDPELLKKLEQHKKQQYRKPKRIPEEFQRGWWIITDIGQIRSIIDSLNEKGFREKHLKKQMTKYLTYVSSNYKAAITEFDICDLDRKVSQESPFGVPEPIEEENWCKDVALRLDVAVLEQIEALEEKISSSSMQIRGWRPSSKLSTDSNTKFELSVLYEQIDDDESGDEKQKSAKSDDQPPPKETKGKKKILDPVKAGRERLLATEAGIERRYLKPPLGFKSNTIIVSSSGSNGDEYADNAADENAPTGLVRWREAVRECRSGSQLALLLHFLESCIAWDKSIMRASCQFCSGGENEAELLLCDGCDKGYHMYCFKPKMETVPDGDWFCYECQNKNTIDKVCIICGKKGKLINCDTCPKVFHPNCLDPPVTKPPKGRWCCNMCNRKPKKIVKGRKTMTSLNAAATSGIEEIPKKEVVTNNKSSSTPKEEPATKKAKTTNRTKKEAKSSQKSSSTTTSANDSTSSSTTTTPKETKKEKKGKQKSEESKEMVICENLLKDLTVHEDCWPFLYPVNTKQFPTYKKIIKKPMDFETIKGNLKAGGYKNKSEFIIDCRLVFDNCETFNEDESPVGIAGHNMRRFMEKKWKELGGEN